MYLSKFARGASKNFVTVVTKIPQNDKNSIVNVVVDIVDYRLSFSFTGGKLNVFFTRLFDFFRFKTLFAESFFCKRSTLVFQSHF